MTLGALILYWYAIGFAVVVHFFRSMVRTFFRRGRD